jgi:hypothetical protein
MFKLAGLAIRSLVFFLYNGKSRGKTTWEEFSYIIQMKYILTLIPHTEQKHLGVDDKVLGLG